MCVCVRSELCLLFASFLEIPPLCVSGSSLIIDPRKKRSVPLNHMTLYILIWCFFSFQFFFLLIRKLPQNSKLPLKCHLLIYFS